MRYFLLVCLLLSLTLIWIGGCSTAAPGITNQAGTYVAAFDGKPDKVTQVAENVCKDLKLTILKANATTLDGLIEAKTAQNSSVTIKISRLNDTQSEVSVRVGVLGDSELSIMILNKIKARL